MKNSIRLIPILVLVVICLCGCSMTLSRNAVDADAYLRAIGTPSAVYQEKSDELLIPFHFSHDDFGKLILFRIKGHAEIKEVELIVQDDNRGALVVVYYKNGMVENYLSSDFSSNPKYVKLDKNWTIIEDYEFESLVSG